MASKIYPAGPYNPTKNSSLDPAASDSWSAQACKKRVSKIDFANRHFCLAGGACQAKIEN